MTLVTELTRPAEDKVLAAGAGLRLVPRPGEGWWHRARRLPAASRRPTSRPRHSSSLGWGDWIGKNNRESLAAPLLDFRQSLQSMGLLRKYKGTLLLTRAGSSAQGDPQRLWDLLADKLISTADGFDRDATLMLLTYAASSAGQEIPLEPIAEALAHLGWQHRDGRPLDGYELYRLAAFDTLINVSDEPAELGGRRRISPAPAALARAALVH